MPGPLPVPDRGHSPAWPFALFALIGLVLFAPVLFGGKTLYPTDMTNKMILPFAAGQTQEGIRETALSDYIMYYYPVRYFQAVAFRSGHLNLWNPYIFGGQPAFANNGSMVAFDPFNVFMLWLDLPAAMAWRSALQTIVCMAFMYLYLRYLGLQLAACLLGAIAWSLNSMFWANAFDWSIGGVLWLPLLCLLVDRAIAAPSPRRVALTGIVMGVALLASPLQIYLYLCCAVAGLVGFRWLLLERNRRTFQTALIVGAVVFLIGIGMTAVQMLPSFELYSHSARFANGLRAATTQLGRTWGQTGVATAALASFVFPNLSGRMKDSMVISGVLWHGETHWQGFIGLVPFFLAAVGAWAGLDRRRIPYLALAGAVVVSVLYTPLGPILYDRFFIVYIFCASVLAAFGCTALMDASFQGDRARRIWRALALFVAAVAVVIIGINLALLLASDRILAVVDARVTATLPTNYFGVSYPALYLQKARHYFDDLRLWSPHTAVPLGLAAAGLMLISLRLSGRLPARAFAALAVAMTLGDMGFMTLSHINFVDKSVYPFTPASPAITLVQQNIGLHRVISHRALPEAPVLPKGFPSMYGIECADGNENLGPPNLLSLLSFDTHACGDELCVTPGNTDVTNVKYVFAGPRTRLPSERFDLVYDREIRVYENRTPMDRAFFVSDYEVIAETSRAIERVRDESFDPRRTVILDREPPIEPAMVGARTDVTVEVHEPLEVRLRVEAPASGLVVMSDTWYPGWQATVDERSAPILRANGVMRAVAVGAGTHTVTFTYAPSPFRTGAIISFASLALALAVALVAPELKLGPTPSIDTDGGRGAAGQA